MAERHGSANIEAIACIRPAQTEAEFGTLDTAIEDPTDVGAPDVRALCAALAASVAESPVSIASKKRNERVIISPVICSHKARLTIRLSRMG
jgi:hypothetical protein